MMQSSGRPILLVEDSRTYAVMMRTTLERLGCSVEHVMTLRGALATLRERTYHAILFDLFLPDSDGVEGIEKLLDVTDAPVIVLTALEDENTARAALRIGADDYIFKGGLDQALLWRTLNRAVERQFYRLKQRDRYMKMTVQRHTVESNGVFERHHKEQRAIAAIAAESSNADRDVGE